MTDSELLELAAKAENREWFHYSSGKGLCCKAPGMSVEYYWNPLINDGDALRLAVKLGLLIEFPSDKPYGPDRVFINNGYGVVVDISDDPYTAARRAIVRASAAIGEQMK